MRTISILSFVAIAAGAKLDPVIPGCPCLQNNTCRPQSNCRIALARTKRELDLPLNRLDRRLLKDYGIGECLNCNSAEQPLPEPFIQPSPIPPQPETVVVYRPQPVVQAVPEYVLRKPIVARRPDMVVPKTVRVPVQYVDPPAAVPQRVVQVVSQPRVVRTVTVPIQPTRCQERKLQAAAKKAAMGLEYAEPCPLCQSCGQEVLPPQPTQPTLLRRTITTETDTAPVPVIEPASTREE